MGRPKGLFSFVIVACFALATINVFKEPDMERKIVVFKKDASQEQKYFVLKSMELLN